eukprot:COSAG01_NODE_200_length_22187_cov_59.140529_21_plen_73_part_00
MNFARLELDCVQPYYGTTYEMDPEPEYEEHFDASTYWYPHEKCMMLSVAPQVSLTITAADYLSCPEFHAVHA